MADANRHAPKLARHKTRRAELVHAPRAIHAQFTQGVDALSNGDYKPMAKFVEGLDSNPATVRDMISAGVDARDRTILHVTVEANREMRNGSFAAGVGDGKGLSEALVWTLELVRDWKVPDINAVDVSGWSALLCACAEGDLDVCSALLQLGADPTQANDQGSTPLHYLSRRKFDSHVCCKNPEHHHIPEAAANAGLPLGRRDIHRVHKSVRSKAVHKLRHLRHRSHDDSSSSESLAIPERLERSRQIMSELLRCGATVDAVNSIGETPLMQAAGRGNVEAVKFLLANGAKVTLKNTRDETALYYAYQADCEATVTLLLGAFETSNTANEQHVAHVHSDHKPLRALDGITMQECDFHQIVQAAKEQMVMKDRKGVWLTHKQTFLGSELVDWLIQNLPFSERDEATAFGNRLMRAGMVRPMIPRTKFKDSEGRTYTFNSNLIGSDSDGLKSRVKSSVVSLQDFQLEQVLGRGAFGIVFLATHKTSGNQYALKKVERGRVGESDSREFRGLMAEKRILANDSSFLCHIHFAFQTATSFYLAMDFLGGGDLVFLMQRLGRLREVQARFLLAEIALGIDYLHTRGVLYRDLKMSNVLLTSKGHAVLADFGLSKEVDSTSDSMTGMHTACGTPAFSAPEVLEGEPYGKAVDWWSFGIVAFGVTMGQAPFHFTGDFEALLYQIRTKGPDFTTVRSSLPSLEDIPVSNAAQNFIRQFLTADVDARLTEFETIKRHAYFSPAIDWHVLGLKKEKSPLAPVVRQWRDNFDPKLAALDVRRYSTQSVEAVHDVVVDEFDYIA